MSQKCPKCSTAVEHDFGVTSCTKCGAILFVDFDGQIEVSNPDIHAKTEEPVPTPSATTAQKSQPVPMMNVKAHLDTESAVREETVPHAMMLEDFTEHENAEADVNQAAEDVFKPNFEYQNQVSEGSESPIHFGGEYGSAAPTYGEGELDAQPLEEAAALDEADAYTHIPAPPAELVAASEAEAQADNGEYADLKLDENAWQGGGSSETVFLTQQPSDRQQASGLVDFSDVVDFANSSELDNSALVYTLRIEGIDHRDTRRKVESVLAEPRLNFHLKDILPQIRGGVLELRDLSPIKTSFIASKLREEAVEFRWKQSVYDGSTDSDFGATGTES